MKKIIHIGLPKTGTTFLQRKYFPGLDNPARIKNYSDYAKDKYRDVLISEEALSGLPWNDKWKRGIPNEYCYQKSFENSIMNLYEAYPDARIIVAFRRHGDWLISLYSQYVLEGGVLKFNEFYNNKGVIKPEDLNFSAKIAFLKSRFKWVDILSFEKFKLAGIEYYDHYFEQLGYKPSVFRSSQQTHPGITGKKLDLLRRINGVYTHLPCKVRNVLRKNQLEPRNILSRRLKFWKTTINDDLKRAKEDINNQFIDDWNKCELEFFK